MIDLNLLGFINSRDFKTRQEWLEAVDDQAAAAERVIKRGRNSRNDLDRERVSYALDFLEAAKAVLYWLRHNQYPDTRHGEVKPAIQHIQSCLEA